MKRKRRGNGTGQIVFWNDPDNATCSGYCKVLKEDAEGCFVLSRITVDRNGMYEDGSIVEAESGEIDFLNESEQVEALVFLFRNDAGWK